MEVEEDLKLRLLVRYRKERMERVDLLREALHGRESEELRSMVEKHSEMVYEAMRGQLRILREKHLTLVQLCAAKRSYEVPPEFSGILNTERRWQWSPIDTEIARVLVASTIAEPGARVLYSDLVSRLDSIVTTARAHIYRSLKVVLRDTPGRSGLVYGLRFR